MDKGLEEGHHNVDRGRCSHAATYARGARKIFETPLRARASQLASLLGGDSSPTASIAAGQDPMSGPRQAAVAGCSLGDGGRSRLLGWDA